MAVAPPNGLQNHHAVPVAAPGAFESRGLSHRRSDAVEIFLRIIALFLAAMASGAAIAASIGGDSKNSFVAISPPASTVIAVLGSTIMNYPAVMARLKDPLKPFRDIIDPEAPITTNVLRGATFLTAAGVYDLAYAASAYYGCIDSQIGEALSSESLAAESTCGTTAAWNGIINALVFLLLAPEFIKDTLPKLPTRKGAPFLLLSPFFLAAQTAIFNTTTVGVGQIPGFSNAKYPIAVHVGVSRAAFSLDAMVNPDKRNKMLERLAALIGKGEGGGRSIIAAWLIAALTVLYGLTQIPAMGKACANNLGIRDLRGIIVLIIIGAIALIPFNLNLLLRGLADDKEGVFTPLPSSYHQLPEIPGATMPLLADAGPDFKSKHLVLIKQLLTKLTEHLQTIDPPTSTLIARITEIASGADIPTAALTEIMRGIPTVALTEWFANCLAQLGFSTIPAGNNVTNFFWSIFGYTPDVLVVALPELKESLTRPADDITWLPQMREEFNAQLNLPIATADTPATAASGPVATV